MAQVDGVLAPVKARRKGDYTRFASQMAAIFKEYGALFVTEC